MRKISKAVAALTAGCMLLSTSAFAAITDNIDGKAQLVNGEYTVNLDYTTAGQSTIIVLKEGTALADANETNILYINQAAIADGKATYAINLGTSFAGNAVVYAGGTAETATELGTLTTIKDVVGLTLAADKTTLEIGETATITPTFDPEDATDKTLTWTSSNDAIATVANGVVTAVAEGTATITATTTNGKTATIDITVNAAAPAGATNVSITYANGEVVPAKAHTNELVPVEFKAVVEGTPVGEVVWSVSDETVGTISADGVFTPGMTLGSTLGEVVIKATVDGKEASVTLNVWRYGDIDQDGWPSEEDAKELNLLQVGESSLYAPFMEDLETGELSWIWFAGDLDQDGWPSEEDAKCLNLFQVGSYDDLWGMLPAE